MVKPLVQQEEDNVVEVSAIENNKNFELDVSYAVTSSKPDESNSSLHPNAMEFVTEDSKNIRGKPNCLNDGNEKKEKKKSCNVQVTDSQMDATKMNRNAGGSECKDDDEVALVQYDDNNFHSDIGEELKNESEKSKKQLSENVLCISSVEKKRHFDESAVSCITMKKNKTELKDEDPSAALSISESYSSDRLEANDDESSSDDGIDVSVDLPLAGPFVLGVITENENFMETFEGDRETEMDDVTSKILFDLTRNGAKIDSQKDTVTFTLGTTEAIASEFISSRRSACKDVVSIAYIEMKKNHNRILNKTKSVIDEYILKQNAAYEEKMSLMHSETQKIQKEVENIKKHYEGVINQLRAEQQNEIEKREKHYKKKIQGLKANHKKNSIAMMQILEDERKMHRRALESYMQASVSTLKRLKDDSFSSFH